VQRGLLQIVAALLIAAPSVLRADGGLTTASLDADVHGFLGRELAAHLADIPSLDPAPGYVLGAQTTGEYTWGTFMRSLAAYAQLVLMPAGYHPNVAAPGGSINFLWMMAANREGDDRQFGVVNVQPDYAAGGSGLDRGRAERK
jgi:hypothetical protein